jgi:hypothetical protein
VRHVPDIERRARLVRRHALGSHRVDDPVAAARAVVCLHATEPATVYLSVAARTHDASVADIDHALHEQRGLVKQLAMRRTLFAFPRDLLPAVWGSASARVARTEHRKIAANVVAHGLTDDGERWLAEARTAVLDLLGADGALAAQQIRERVPALDVAVPTAPGTTWGGPTPIAPRVLTWLGARADIVRGPNGGHWRTSRPQWTPMPAWLGEEPVAADEATGYAELVRRWLARFGPGTEADLVWWLGSTKSAVRRALADVGAVEVSLERDATGWVLPEDVEPEPPVAPEALLLPVLDPTVMGWRDRDFYLGGLGPQLFDRNGNAGTTAWWDGRAVGTWVQGPDHVVRVHLLDDVPPAGRQALDAEAARLTSWLGGVGISTVYPSPAMKLARGA